MEVLDKLILKKTTILGLSKQCLLQSRKSPSMIFSALSGE